MNGLRLADPAASRAVLAGVWDYQHLAPLPAVAHNVAGLADALADPRIWGLPQKHITRVEPGNVQDSFIRTVAAAAQEATDTLLVYFAGHGIPDDFSDELYLGLPGTRRGELDTALRYEFISRKLRLGAAKARHVVVILDCCFSGLAANARMSPGQRLADLAAVSSRAVFTASAETKVAMAPVGAAYTAFTGVLLGLLDGGIPGEPELLSMQTLHNHAYARLRGQQPELASRGAGSLVCIARNTRPEPAAAPPGPAPVPGAVPAQPNGLPARMPVLVRERLLGHQRRIKGLTVLGPGRSTPSWITKEIPRHALSAGEEVLAAWQWSHLYVFRRSRLLFTSRGLRTRQGDSRMMFPYTGFGNCEFSAHDWTVGASLDTPETYHALLTVSDHDQSWTSPDLGGSSATAYGLAAVLQEIRSLVTDTA
ncbi:caspase domain-containing protein [Streptomyces venezuelae]|uniref:caspase family protein n=1 Tax=Streptomyces venezuelae TaxID=54571 RepID=UPI001681769B|nr:caspase family protein [Streptomyces venezuelae]